MGAGMRGSIFLCFSVARNYQKFFMVGNKLATNFWELLFYGHYFVQHLNLTLICSLPVFTGDLDSKFCSNADLAFDCDLTAMKGYNLVRYGKPQSASFWLFFCVCSSVIPLKQL